MHLTDPELFGIHNACDFIQCAAVKYHHVKARYIVEDLAVFFQEKPNATTHQLADFLGSSDAVAENMFATAVGYLPGPAGENLQALISYINGTLPYLPRNLSTKPPGFDGIIFTLMALVILVVGARLYSRFAIMGGFLKADYAIIASTIITLAFTWLTWINYTFWWNILGNWEITQWQHLLNKKFNFSLWCISLIMLWTIKVSLLLFYWQLTCWRPLRIAVWVTFAIITSSTIAGFFGYIFMCKPVLYWTVLNAKCLEQGGIFLIMSGFTNVITDIAIWVIPMPLLWKLQVPKKDRNWAVFIFGLGLVSCIAGTVKVVMIHRGWMGKSTLADNGGGVVTLFGNLEAQFAIICASLPALRPLARKYTPRLVSQAADTVDGGVDVIPRRTDVEMRGGAGEEAGEMGSEVALSPTSDIMREEKILANVGSHSTSGSERHM